jgi:glycerophosphoryl diester phosphodiesterase
MSSPWLDRRVIAYAHQGGAKEAPSSTIFAIRQALSLGVPAIELDVHATADGRLVVCHDATLDRTTNGHGAIAAHTLAEVRMLDNAYWFVPGEDAVSGRDEDDYPLRGRFPDDAELGVATLEEVLETCEGVLLNLDIKRSAPDVFPYESALAQMLTSHGRTDDVIVASFLDSATDAFRELAPRIGTSAGTVAVAEFVRAVRAGLDPPESARRHVALQVPASFSGIEIVDEKFVEVAHEYGLAVHVWTIDDEEEMRRLVALGVDGIVTDRPSVLQALLESAGVAWKQ